MQSSPPGTASFLPQPPSAAPPSNAPARPNRGAVASSPCKSRIPMTSNNSQNASDSSILSTYTVQQHQQQTMTTPMSNIKRRGIPSTPAGDEGIAHRVTDSPPAHQDELSPANEWLGVQQPEPSPSPRCMASASQRSRGNQGGVNGTSTVRASSSRGSGGRVAFGGGSMKASLSPPGPPVPKQQELGGQAHGQQQQARPASRGQETRGSMLRRSAINARLSGIHSQQSGTFGSTIGTGRSVSNTRSASNTRGERPASASVTPPAAGAAGARVRPSSAPRVARSPSVARSTSVGRRPTSATASTAANAAGNGTRSSSSIAASMRQSGSGSVVRQLVNESPAHGHAYPSPARRSESNIGAGIAAANAAKAGQHAGGPGGGAAQGSNSHASILSSIPEKPAIHYPAKNAHGPKPAGTKPSFVSSLDFSSLKKDSSPSPPPLSGDKSATTPGSSSSKPSPPVPKLNLMPLLKEQEEHAQSVKEAYREASAEAEEMPTAHEGGKPGNSKDSAASHKKGPHSGGGGGAVQKKAPPPEPPQDHFYFYPKMDPNDERKTMEAISRMPKPVQRHMRKIYDEMVEAKQNCEAIAFRGHRLLDQLQTHHKEKMEMREQEMARMEQEMREQEREMQAYQAQAEETQRELERIRAVLLARSNGEAVGELGSLRGLHNHAGKWLFSDSPMADISDGPEQDAYLEAQRQAVDAMLRQVQGDITSSRNEMSKLHASSQLQHMLHGPPTSSATTTAAALAPQQAQTPPGAAAAAAAAAPPGGPVHVPRLKLGAMAHTDAPAPSAQPPRPVDLQVLETLNLGAMAHIDAPTPSAHPPPHNPGMDTALSHLQQQQQQQQQQREGGAATAGAGPVAPPAIPKLDLKGALGHPAKTGQPAPHMDSTAPATAGVGGSTASPKPSADSDKVDMRSAAEKAVAAAAAAAAARAQREAMLRGAGAGAKAGGGSKAGVYGERDDVVGRGGQDQASGHHMAGDVAKQQDKPVKGGVAGSGAQDDDCMAEGDQQVQMQS